MSWMPRLASLLLAAVLCSAAAFAQGTATEPAPEPTVAELQAQLDDMPMSVTSNQEVRSLLAQLNAISKQSDKFIASRIGQLNDLNARLGELGNAPAGGATAEDADITRQRTALLKERNAIDADIRLARLVTVNAQQRGSELLTKRRALFEAQLTERAPSPLGREFWRDIVDAWPTDVIRLKRLGAEMKASLRIALEPAHVTAVFASVIIALLIALPGNWAAERALARLAARVLPTGRLRRSLLVIAIVTTNVLLIGLAAQGVYATLDAHGMLGTQTSRLAQAMVQSIIFIAFVVGLGRALLSNTRPSWRLPPIPNAIARRLAPYPWLTSLIAVLVWLPAQVNALVEASFAAAVATHVITALSLTALIGAMLLRLNEPRAATTAGAAPDAKEAGTHEATETPAETERPLWIGILLTAVALMVVVIWVLVAVGYVAMASFLANQLTWTGIVAAAFYVLFKFADDAFMATVSSRSSFGQRLQKSFGLAPRTLDQAAVVLSGLSRVALFFYMVIALATPLGTSPGEVFQRSGKFGTGVKIGEFQLVPGAIFSAIAVLAVGFIALRVLRRWLETHFLPQTALEPGMQSSITTLLGYVVGIFVIASSLSALGVGVERIAWVASALSVGIGFGLQAIVQNFISGLILLAERPVKVGDWVVLGTTEGDVRRINVRATEIQLGDRSTLIVPNSEFITKTVRNMTLANPEGRVLIRLPMPLTTDANRAREAMLAACAGHPGVLPAPAPSVTLEGIENAMLIFQTIAFVQSPRLAGGVRSDLMFTILDLLKQAELPLAVPTVTLSSASGQSATSAPPGPPGPPEPPAPPAPLPVA
ncbi:MAG: mechanosensitive ion channel family protein [Variovorax sp.]|nr:MAG: mechanosensitive ion channel family protein [Variovorax sp.]